MSYFLQKRLNNMWVGQFSSFPSELVTHGISTRLGGVSQKPYDNLNVALQVGDRAEDVLENRRRFADALGVDASRICTVKQIHSANVIKVSEKDAGRGSLSYADAFDDVDALITDTVDLPLMLCFADCVPVFFFDEKNHAVGVAHAGWKGTVLHIGVKTLEKMTEVFGTNPSECYAAIGPSIGPNYFEVGQEVYREFQEAFPYVEELITNKEPLKINLWEANRRQLIEAGMKSENIDIASACTCEENSWYYSYRQDNGTTGRIGALISLKKKEEG